MLQQVLLGNADVGFVEAGRLEDAEEAGRVPLKAFRSVEPITNHVLSGQRLYPFQVSTLLYPNAPLVMHSSVDSNVQRLLSTALLNVNASSAMARAGGYAGWRPAANYLEVIQAMTLAGIYDPETDQCGRVSSVAESIVCPEQYTSRGAGQVLSSCDRSAHACPAALDGNSTYTCICSACVPSCGENQLENDAGVCECRRGFVNVAGKCIPTYALALIILTPVLIALVFIVRCMLKWQQRRSDQLWHIKPHELEFDDPAKCLGSGSFGVVLQAEYRGSVVALKSVLQPGQRLSTTLEHMKSQRSGLFHRGGEGNSTKASRAGRGLFSGFDYIAEPYERGLCKLKRALNQATAAARESRNENTQGESRNNTSRAAHSRARAVARLGARPASRSRSRSRWSVSSVFTSRARRERQEFIEEMRLLSKLRHPCVTTVIGAVLEPNCPPILVMEHMDLGSLHSLLHNPSMEVDDETNRMMMLDIVHGCRFLHAFDPPVIHGDLKAMVG